MSEMPISPPGWKKTNNSVSKSIGVTGKTTVNSDQMFLQCND